METAQRSNAPLTAGTSIAEVIGPPAAGKSTLVSGVSARSTSVVVMSRYRHPLDVFAYAASAVGILPSLPRLRAHRAPFRESRQMVRLRSSHAVVGRHVRRSSRAVIFDQGPVYVLQRLGAAPRAQTPVLAFRRWRDAEIERWSQLLDVVIVVDAPDDVLIERIARRCKPHILKGAPATKMRAALSRDRDEISEILQQLQARGLPATVQIDTAEEPSHQAVGRAMSALGIGPDQPGNGPGDSPIGRRR